LTLEKRIYLTCRANNQKKLGNQKEIRHRRRRALEKGHRAAEKEFWLKERRNKIGRKIS
jgi:hypothetical protein